MGIHLINAISLFCILPKKEKIEEPTVVFVPESAADGFPALKKAQKLIAMN
jgi:hypothetical protein